MKNTSGLNVVSPYLRDIYDPEKVGQTFTWLTREVGALREEFDALAFTGSSGAIALAVGISLGIPVTHVRKDPGHSYLSVEGAVVERYAIIDDFVSTGTTVERVISKIKEDSMRDRIFPPPRFPYLFLYHSRYSPSHIVRLLEASYDMRIISRSDGQY